MEVPMKLLLQALTKYLCGVILVGLDGYAEYKTKVK